MQASKIITETSIDEVLAAVYKEGKPVEEKGTLPFLRNKTGYRYSGRWECSQEFFILCNKPSIKVAG